jgi:hypothetical protein
MVDERMIDGRIFGFPDRWTNLRIPRSIIDHPSIDHSSQGRLKAGLSDLGWSMNG